MTTNFPELLKIEALELGKAAEHLVCADLIIGGNRAYLSDQGLPYDVVVDIDGRLVRIQVKATTKPRNANAKGRAPNFVYQFAVRRRGARSKGERLSEKHCDLVALVALDLRVVAYMPVREVGQTVALFPPGYEFKGKFKRSRYAPIDGFSFSAALARCAP